MLLLFSQDFFRKFVRTKSTDLTTEFNAYAHVRAIVQKIFLVRGVGGFINGTYKIEIEEYKGTDNELQEILYNYRKEHECKVPAHDAVEHPAHYETGKFECIDVMLETQGVEAVKDFCVCNAFKYLYRHGRKNGAEDIKKAIWYLNKWVELDDNSRAEKAVK